MVCYQNKEWQGLITVKMNRDMSKMAFYYIYCLLVDKEVVSV